MTESPRLRSALTHPITLLAAATAVLTYPAAVVVTLLGWSVRLGNLLLLVSILVSLPYVVWGHLNDR